MKGVKLVFISRMPILLVLLMLFTPLWGKISPAADSLHKSRSNLSEPNWNSASQPQTHFEAEVKSVQGWLQRFAATKLGVGVLFLLFILLLIAPFAPSVIEMLYPKDREPLTIDQNYIRDPRYFERQFREDMNLLMASSMVNQNIKPKYQDRIPVDHFENLEVPFRTRISEVLIVSKELVSETEVDFRQPIYVQGNAILGVSNDVNAILCDGNITLAENCIVDKWIGCKGSINAGSNCHLGRRTAADGLVLLDKGCFFNSVFAMPVATYEADFKVIGGAVELPEAGQDPITQMGDFSWYLSKNFTTVPPYSIVNNPMIVKSNLILRKGTVVNGNLKVYGNVIMEPKVRIFGDIIAEGNIEIGEDSFIRENLFTQGHIYIHRGVRIGVPNHYKSTIAKKGIRIEGNVIIYGFLLAEMRGRII